MKLTQSKLLTICDRNTKRMKKNGARADEIKSYRRGFFNHNFNKRKDSDK